MSAGGSNLGNLAPKFRITNALQGALDISFLASYY
jgi:hypothetical protein